MIIKNGRIIFSIGEMEETCMELNYKINNICRYLFPRQHVIASTDIYEDYDYMGFALEIHIRNYSKRDSSTAIISYHTESFEPQLVFHNEDIEFYYVFHSSGNHVTNPQTWINGSCNNCVEAQIMKMIVE